MPATVVVTVGIARGTACEGTDGTGNHGPRDSPDGCSPMGGATVGAAGERQCESGGKE